MNRHGQIPAHGTLSRYRGTTGVPACRCKTCSARAVREATLRELDRLAGRPRLVPAAPVQQHLSNLRARGLTYAQIARACGNDPTSVSEIARGQRTSVLRRVAEAVLSVPLNWTEPEKLVDSTGSMRRLQALYAMGVPRKLIASKLGVSEPFINLLVNGRHREISAHRAAAIKALYNQLWSVPGSSVKNRYRAQREGWPGPLHWNDESIDDPAGYPDWTGACGTPLGYRRHRYASSATPLCKPCAQAQAAKHADAQLAA